MLGIGPAFGRASARPMGGLAIPQALIVSHGFWQQRLGGRTDAVGRPIRLDGSDYALRGVLPQRLGRSSGTGILRRRSSGSPASQRPVLSTPPWASASEPSGGRRAEELRAINGASFRSGRLLSGRQSHVEHDGSATPLSSAIPRPLPDSRSAAVALVWLIACTNASNLLIARVTSRRRELAVRAALGASRGRVIRHLLVESALLATGAVIVGGGSPGWASPDAAGDGATYFPRTQEIAFDGPVLGDGRVDLRQRADLRPVPAVHGTGGPVDESLRSLGRSSTGSLGVQRLRRALVGSQFAIATPLLVVAGLLLGSLNALKQVDSRLR